MSISLLEAVDVDTILSRGSHLKSLDGVTFDSSMAFRIFDADPTARKIYHRWILGLYPKYALSDFQDILPDVNVQLQRYERVKHRLPLDSRNILNIKTLDDLHSIIDGIPDDALLSNRQKRGDTLVDGEYEIVHDGPEFKVVVPLTHRASCYFGSGSKLCTAISDSPNHFNSYTANGGKLYMIILKSTDKLVAQLSFRNLEFRDAKNEELNLMIELTDIPELRKAILSILRDDPSQLNGGKFVFSRGPKDVAGAIFADPYLSDINKMAMLRIIHALGYPIDECYSGYSGLTPLMMAITMFMGAINYRDLNIFLKLGADFNKYSSLGFKSDAQGQRSSALVLLCELRNKYTLDNFIMHNPDVEINDPNASPLLRAISQFFRLNQSKYTGNNGIIDDELATRNKMKIGKLLLATGADPCLSLPEDAKSWTGGSPIACYISHMFYDIHHLAKLSNGVFGIYLEFLELLLKYTTSPITIHIADLDTYVNVIQTSDYGASSLTGIEYSRYMEVLDILKRFLNK